MNTQQSWGIDEVTERIVILYANYSGRESANRAVFREDVRKILSSLVTNHRNWILKQIIEKLKSQIKE